MVHAIAQSLVICIVGWIVYSVLAGVSLSYFVARDHPRQHIVKDFLEGLRFPFDRIVTFLPTGKPEGAAEALLQNHFKDAIVLRYVSGAIMIAIPLLFGYGLLQQEKIEGKVTAMIIFVYCCANSIFSWRFGHKLKRLDTE